ncbi:CD151 antigen [Orussus abietinus]|uniref:CD151 antigen n=1 Tax=Orussus abietinus TaxID=222816 RepID=UPI00062568CD|nr:CD151 antigen [Orussus abietinus]
MGYGTEMDGCGNFMKYCLFFMNFIIFIGGSVVAGLAIWALVDNVPWIGELIGSNLLTGAVYILLIGGIVVAFIAFCGCVGASREIKCMLLTYLIIVFFLFVTMLVGGTLGYVYREKVTDSVEKEMKGSLRLYDHQKSVREAWDITQTTLHCCGVHGWADWGTNGLRIPQSCCRPIQPGQYYSCNSGVDVNPTTIYTDGCLTKTQNFMQKHAAILGGAGIAVACFMFFGMVFSCALFKMIE